MSVIYRRTVQNKIERSKGNRRDLAMLFLNIVTIAISIVSIGVNMVLTTNNTSLNQQTLSLQQMLYNYPPSVIGFQREIPLIKYEDRSGVAKVTVVIISPHSGYFNLSLSNFTMIETNLNTSLGNNEVIQENAVIFQQCAVGSNRVDNDVRMWANLHPADEYLPPKANAARFCAGSILFEIKYYDPQTENTTRSIFPCSLWVSVNETGL